MAVFLRRRDGYGGFVPEKSKGMTAAKERAFHINGATAESKGLCVCKRPRQVIFCHSCCHRFHGHLAYQCSNREHTCIYLMDLDTCPKCGSCKLTEVCDASCANKMELKEEAKICPWFDA